MELSTVIYLLLLVASRASTRTSFTSPATQNLFNELISSHDIGSGLIAVTNFANLDILKEDELVDQEISEGPPIFRLPGTNLAVFDCAMLRETSRDVELALGTSSAIICDLDYHDVLRGVDVFPVLQTVMETVAWGGGGSKKHLFVVCKDCDVENSQDFLAALRMSVELSWKAALKPFSHEKMTVDENFHIHCLALPDQKKDPTPSASRRASLVSALLDTKAERSSEQLGVCLKSASFFCNQRSPPASGSSSEVDEVLSNLVCNSCLEAALNEFVEGLQDLSAELSGTFDSFGDICNEALDQTLSTYDALTTGIDESSTKSEKRADLQRRLLGALEPFFRSQLKQLGDLSWDRLRDTLSKLRVGPSLFQEMESAVQDAERFYRNTATSMLCRDASWCSDFERRALVTKMRRFVTERLQAARLQGAYVPGMFRRPIALSFHYLATQPFSMLDALQDRLSYEEDMEWDPEIGTKEYKKSQLTTDLPKEVNAASKRMSTRAER